MSFKRQLNVNCLCFDEFMSWFHQQNTTKPDDFTASYKFRSLKRFLSRGDFKPPKERVQTDKRKISKRLYGRPAKQYMYE